MADVVMPRLSDAMEEGTIVAWLKADGDEVARGEELVSIETDKAEVVYEAEVAGVLRILVPEGASAAVGAPIAVLGADGPAAPAPELPAPVAAPAPGPAVPAPAPVGVSASPVARRAATALGIALEHVAGSGPRGRILKADVRRAAENGAPAAPTAEPVGGARGDAQRLELTRMQQTVARRMAESKATVPDFAVRADVDMGALEELRTELKEMAGSAPSVTAMIVRACAQALREHPRVNGSYKDAAFELHARVNVGVAVALPDGLVVPVVHDADRLTATQIAERVRELAARSRDGSVTPPELAGGTFTVSNLGMHDVDAFAGIVNAPQAAILCVGATRPRPAVLPDGSVGPRPLATMTLVSDHRILYGADAAAFLAEVRRRLERPLGLLS